MRLIDADELMKDRVENDPVRIAAMCAPIAYDLDKVIDHLETEEDLALKRYADCHTYALPATYVRHKTRYEEIRNCLKIVKSGICQKKGATDDE